MRALLQEIVSAANPYYTKRASALLAKIDGDAGAGAPGRTT